MLDRTPSRARNKTLSFESNPNLDALCGTVFVDFAKLVNDGSGQNALKPEADCFALIRCFEKRSHLRKQFMWLQMLLISQQSLKVPKFWLNVNMGPFLGGF